MNDIEHLQDPSADDTFVSQSSLKEKADKISFAHLGLSKKILNAVAQNGYEYPTPIQEKTIPVLLEGKDVVGIAQTGTGKTAAFALPILEHINPDKKQVQALVLAPTRELAMQTAVAMENFIDKKSKISVVAVYGGSSYAPQISALKSGAQIVVGTPGRIMDLMEKDALDLGAVSFLVLDEADEMLRMGFAEDVESIVQDVPEHKQTALFSATMPDDIRRIADQHLNNPVEIRVAKQSTTTTNINQTYAVVPYKHKIGALSRVLATKDYGAAIVFVRTRATAEEVALELGGYGILAAAISGDVPQKEREKLVDRIKNGSLNILIATDVAARGIDIDRIGLVVNFDVPRENEVYVHRIGRTGRAGRKGEALTFLTPKESAKLRQIEKLTGATITEITIPTPRDVSIYKAKAQMRSVIQRMQKPRLELYSDIFTEVCTEHDLSPTQAAAALLSLAVGDMGPADRVEKKSRVRYEENVDDNGDFISAVFEVGRDKTSRKSLSANSYSAPKPVEQGARRYRIEVGHKDGVRPAEIVGAIAGESSLSGAQIGRIDILPTFTLVDIHAELTAKDMRRLARTQVKGRALRIALDKGPKNATKLSGASRHRDNLRIKRMGKDYSTGKKSSIKNAKKKKKKKK